ncbi:MAG: hypothetical protein AAB074_11550 [Planctomycetota bacterium]
MRIFLTTMFLWPACLALAEEPVTLAWNVAEGDSFLLQIVSDRRAEMQSGKQPLPLATRFQITITGALTVGAAAEDGARKFEFSFASLEGTVEALGVKLSISEKPEDISGKKISATLSAAGQLTWDEEALKKVAEGIDLNEDFAHLLPALPKAPVRPNESWEAEVDRHTNTCELVRREVTEKGPTAVLKGKSKADETSGEGDLKSSLRVDGTFSGEWDLDRGYLRVFDETRTEEAKIVTKDSVLITKSEVKRRVVLGKVKRD